MNREACSGLRDCQHGYSVRPYHIATMTESSIPARRGSCRIAAPQRSPAVSTPFSSSLEEFPPEELARLREVHEGLGFGDRLRTGQSSNEISDFQSQFGGFSGFQRATSSASLAATSAIGFSEVLRPLREPSRGLTSRRASYVVPCTMGTSRSRARSAESSLQGSPARCRPAISPVPCRFHEATACRGRRPSR